MSFTKLGFKVCNACSPMRKLILVIPNVFGKNMVTILNVLFPESLSSEFRKFSRGQNVGLKYPKRWEFKYIMVFLFSRKSTVEIWYGYYRHTEQKNLEKE